MYLGYFTEKAYDKLLHNIAVNSEKYSEDKEWLDDYFAGEDYFGISKSVEVNAFRPSYQKVPKKSDEQKSQEDLVNIRLIYDAFKNLSPLQASNKYMWTYLCHSNPEYRAYIQDRWMETERSNTIKTRFFVTGSNSLLNDNALSRLWWYGYLTYDNNKTDPYALTKILMMNQTICTDVMDTMNRMKFSRMKGILYAIQDFQDLLDNSEGITEYFRECKKYLNHYAAVTNLDFLEAEEIRDLAYNYMVILKEQKNGKKINNRK